MCHGMSDSKEGFSEYIGDKRKTRENIGPLLNEVWDLITQDMKKAEVLNLASQECQVALGKDQVREYLSKLGMNKSIGSEGMRHQLLRDLADVILRLP